MSSKTLDRPQARPSPAPPAVSHRKRGPLLVATDASDSSDAAVRAARAITSYTGQDVRVLAVFAPIPLVSPEVQLATTPRMETDGREHLRFQVGKQLARMGCDARWPIEVAVGDPAATIAAAAKALDTPLIVMGLGGHGVFERIFGDEMVLKVLRLGTAPVLAVAGEFTGLPKKVLAAVDFSSSSIRALSLGAALMRANSKVTLAHVISPDLDPSNWNGASAGYQGTVGRQLDRTIAEVGFGDAALVERKVLAGDPAKELLKLVADMNPDLIVTGSHGHNFLTRLLLGSVSTKLLRNAHCSVLVAPPVEGEEFMEELPKVTTQFSHYEWAERLEEFTRRNRGRLATLEEIDPEIGARVEEQGATFAGTVFDPRDGRVAIMVGPPGAVNAHVTRSIGGITAIQVLRDRAGRDLLLRVAHGRGQTLLTLER